MTNEKGEEKRVRAIKIMNQLESLRQQAAILAATHDELVLTKQTLQKLKDLEKDEKALLPVGPNFMVKVNLVDKDHVLYQVNPELVVEMKVDSAIKEIDRMVERIRNDLKRIDEISLKLRKELETILKEIEKK